MHSRKRSGSLLPPELLDANWSHTRDDTETVTLGPSAPPGHRRRPSGGSNDSASSRGKRLDRAPSSTSHHSRRRPSISSQHSAGSGSSASSGQPLRKALIARGGRGHYRAVTLGEAAAMPKTQKGLHVAGLSNEELEELKEVYNAIDKDGSDSIEQRELAHMMEMLNVSVSDEMINTIFKAIDVDGSGDISFQEFAEFMGGTIMDAFPQAKVEEAFKYLSLPTDDPGMLTLSQLEVALHEDMPEEFPTQASASKFLGHLHTNHKGQFNYRAFTQQHTHKSVP